MTYLIANKSLETSMIPSYLNDHYGTKCKSDCHVRIVRIPVVFSIFIQMRNNLRFFFFSFEIAIGYRNTANDQRKTNHER